LDPVVEPFVVVVIVPDPDPGEPVRRGAKRAVASALGAGGLVDPFVVDVEVEVGVVLGFSVRGRRV